MYNIITCPKCGKEITETATLCTACGWKSQKWEENKQKAKTEHSTLIFALASIVALLILGIVGIVAILKGG